MPNALYLLLLFHSLCFFCVIGRILLWCWLTQSQLWQLRLLVIECMAFKVAFELALRRFDVSLWWLLSLLAHDRCIDIYASAFWLRKACYRLWLHDEIRIAVNPQIRQRSEYRHRANYRVSFQSANRVTCLLILTLILALQQPRHGNSHKDGMKNGITTLCTNKAGNLKPNTVITVDKLAMQHNLRMGFGRGSRKQEEREWPLNNKWYVLEPFESTNLPQHE